MDEIFDGPIEVREFGSGEISAEEESTDIPDPAWTDIVEDREPQASLVDELFPMRD